MSLKDLNDQQKLAATTNDKNILVSAGAGSGKTKTLTEKVINIISSKDLNIDVTQLLVLTFTNNAAHEMKTRIIKAFANDPKLEVYKEKIRSAHIQTFDSFAQEIVKMYADKLGLSANFSVIDDNIFKVKTNELLDKILTKYYSDSVKKDKILKTLKKYNINDDSYTKRVVLDLFYRLDKLIPEDRKAKIEFLRVGAFDKTNFLNQYKSIIEYYKDTCIKKVYEAYLELKLGQDVNTLNVKDKFNKDIFDSWDWKDLDFGDTYVQGYYELICDILIEQDDMSFFDLINNFDTNKEKALEGLKAPRVSKKYPETIGVANAYKRLSDIIGKKTSILYALVGIKYNDNEYDIYKSQIEDVNLLLDIVEELKDELNLYKKQANCYTYNDLAKFALDLLTKPEYKQYAKEVINRFKYIMIDEYQDTNDLQEQVINELTKPKDDGSRSILFCVGDAKQSIYAFRNSNVELFRKREDLYKAGNDGQVIYMNTNYRSSEWLIKDINYIFSQYMHIDHGSIAYYNPRMGNPEQLTCGIPCDKLPKHGDKLGKDMAQDYGIKRIFPNGDFYCEDLSAFHQKWEIRAIIEDINKKYHNPDFLIYDRDKKEFRQAEYSDFSIICAEKAGFNDYKREFVKAGIPLNNIQDTYLSEIDAILVIQSLIKYINLELVKTKPNNYLDQKKLLFTSLARSYIFEYDDQKIYDILGPDVKPNDVLNNIDNDVIGNKIKDFIKNNYNKSLPDIFNTLINEFGITTKLNLIGNAQDNISKIEQLYTFILAESEAGEGLENFVKLLSDLDKYELDIEVNSESKVVDAVNMHSIHAAKGLEYKIVYLPYSYNHLMKGGNHNKPPYVYEKDIGVCLPYYELDVNSDKETNTLTIPAIAADLVKDDSVNEHVRLFYVALTRAENYVYIVGWPLEKEESEKNKESIYGMLYYLPHYFHMNPDLPYDQLQNNDKYNDYLDGLKVIEASKPYKAENNSLREQTYEYLYNHYIYGGMVNYVKSLCICLSKQFLQYFVSLQYDEDQLYKIFAWYTCNQLVKGKQDFIKFVNKIPLTQQGKYVWDLRVFNDMDEYEDKQYVISNDNLEEQFDSFVKHLINRLHIDWLAEVDDVYLPDDWQDLLKGFVYAVYGESGYVYIETFKFPHRQDSEDVPTVLPQLLAGAKSPKLVLDDIQVNDTVIDFPLRNRQRASIINVDQVDKELLERGTYMHNLMYLVDLDYKSKTFKDTKFINNDKDRTIIDKVLANKEFNKILNGANMIHKEYGYYDPLLGTNSFIDLLVKKDNQYYIIDYKLEKIDTKKYQNQIESYARNVKDLFKTDKKNIHLIFISLNDGELIEAEY